MLIRMLEAYLVGGPVATALVLSLLVAGVIARRPAR
jgi:hypothetical protein